MIEYVYIIYEHFKNPVKIVNGHYMLPQVLGYSIAMHKNSLKDFEYPFGKFWGKDLMKKAERTHVG